MTDTVLGALRDALERDHGISEPALWIEFIDGSLSILTSASVPVGRFSRYVVEPCDARGSLRIVPASEVLGDCSTLEATPKPTIQKEIKKLNLEFISANPTGPLSEKDFQAGRDGMILSRLYEQLGWQVTREYFVNDRGAQIDAFVRAIHSAAVSSASDHQPDFLIDLANIAKAKLGSVVFSKSEDEWFEALRTVVVAEMQGKVRRDLREHGIIFDEFRFDSAVDTKSIVLDQFQTAGMLGGSSQADGAIVLRTRPKGDVVDRVLRTEDGRWTYLFGDACYHADKLARGYKGIVVLLREDHASYAPALRVMIDALAYPKKPFVTLRSADKETCEKLDTVKPCDPKLLAALWPDILAQAAQTADVALLRNFDTVLNQSVGKSLEGIVKQSKSLLG